MIRMEIKEATATPKGVDFRGKTLTFYEQVAWAYLVGMNGSADPFPTKVLISHEKPDAVYPVGIYTLAPESLHAGRYNRLEVGRIKLKPVAPSAVKSA